MGTERMNVRFDDPVEKRIYQDAKLGASSDTWVVRAAANTWLSTVAASKTAATLIIPLTGLKVGDVITGYDLIGQIESGGNTVTLDAALRKHTAAAADVDDAAVTGGSMTQVSVTADTTLNADNTKLTLASPVTVANDQTFYLLLTATTAASTDIALQGARLYVKPAR